MAGCNPPIPLPHCCEHGGIINGSAARPFTLTDAAFSCSFFDLRQGHRRVGCRSPGSSHNVRSLPWLSYSLPGCCCGWLHMKWSEADQYFVRFFSNFLCQGVTDHLLELWESQEAEEKVQRPLRQRAQEWDPRTCPAEVASQTPQCQLELCYSNK